MEAAIAQAIRARMTTFKKLEEKPKVQVTSLGEKIKKKIKADLGLEVQKDVMWIMREKLSWEPEQNPFVELPEQGKASDRSIAMKVEETVEVSVVVMPSSWGGVQKLNPKAEVKNTWNGRNNLAPSGSNRSGSAEWEQHEPFSQHAEEEKEELYEAKVSCNRFAFNRKAVKEEKWRRKWCNSSNALRDRPPSQRNESEMMLENTRTTWKPKMMKASSHSLTNQTLKYPEPNS